ncbi:hypothetical protein D9M72_161750 [compost metagenome]
MTAPTTAPIASSDDPALDILIDAAQLKKDLDIDPTYLREECARQPGLFLMYANIAVRAKRQQDRYKTVVEMVEAKLDAQYRSTLQEEYEGAIAADPKSRVKAPTEAQVRSSIVNDARWKAAQGRLHDASYIARLADNAVSAMEQRKKSLDNMTSLEVKGGGDGTRVERNRSQQASRQDLLDAMARRRDGTPVSAASIGMENT